MNGVYLNGGDNKTNFLNNYSYEAASLTIMPLIFDIIYHASILSNCHGMFKLFRNPEGKFDDSLYNHYLAILKANQPSPEMPDPESLYLANKKLVDEIMLFHKDIRKVKHLNKMQLIMMQKAKSFKTSVIKFIEEYYQSRYFFFETVKLEWLWKEKKITDLAAELGGNYTSDTLMYVNYLSTTFEVEENFIFTDDLVEKTLQCIEAKACFSGEYNITAENWFVSMPLYDLRSYFTVMPEKEMRLMRNIYLQQAALLHPPVIELEKQLQQTAFTPHNLPQISNLLNQHLGNFNSEEINQKINNDPTIMYYDKLKSDVKPILTLHLGITSPRMLLHHFQRLYIIKPFEAIAVINTIEKIRNPDNAVAFFYTTMITEKDGVTERGMGIPLNDKTIELIDQSMPIISA
jgi:hypothetical protein